MQTVEATEEVEEIKSKGLCVILDARTLIVERVVEKVKEILIIDSAVEATKAVFVWGSDQVHVFRFIDNKMQEPEIMKVTFD